MKQNYPGKIGDGARFPQRGGNQNEMQILQEVGKEKEIRRFRNEKKKSKPGKQASALELYSEIVAFSEQIVPSPEEIERYREEKRRPATPAPAEPGPAPKPEPESAPEDPKE